jgi:hypothetical protein
MAYFYFDFRDNAKQGIHGFLTSILRQLSAKSDRCYDILSDLYSRHDAGSQQPSDHELKRCLVDMLRLPEQPVTYVIMDALDECPNASGVVSPRDQVIELVEELVELGVPSLRLCVTSRPEADIVPTFEPLSSHAVCLHEESGQNEDIATYVRFVVESDRKMRKWRAEDKELVIDVLLRKADGM